MNGSHSAPAFSHVPGTRARPLADVPGFVRRGTRFGVTGLVAALFSPWIALAGSARKILLAIVLLDIPLQIDQNFAYLYEAAELGAVGGFNISLTTIALVGLYLERLIDRLVHRFSPARFSSGALLPVAPFVLVTAASVVTALDVALYARGLFQLLQMFLVYFYLVLTVRTRQDVRFVVMWLLAGLVLEGTIMIAIGLGGQSFAVAGLQGRIDIYTEDFGTAARFGGTVGSPITASAYLEMLLAPALATLATPLARPYKMLGMVGLGLGSVSLVGTFSRGGWLAALLSLSTVCLLLWRRRTLSAAVPVVLLVVLSAVALLFHESIAGRLAGDDQGSARSRVPLMRMAWGIISDSPVLGIGANNYTAAIPRRLAAFGNEWLFTVHNQYLLVWAETGTVGLAAFLFFLFAILRNGWQRWKQTDPLLSPLALGFTAALMGQMVHMQVDIYSTRAQVQLLFVVAALLVAMNRMGAARRLMPGPSTARF